jgi:predicted permease
VKLGKQGGRVKSTAKTVALPEKGRLGGRLRDQQLLAVATQAAGASYVMARAVNGNHQLAAAIIVITTLVAIVTVNLGLLLLQWPGWV